MIKSSVTVGAASHGATARLEEAIDRFEEAWQRGPRPVIDDHLASETDRRAALLVELVHVDLEYRLKAGEAARVEDYLQRYPELGPNRRVVLELLGAEWRLRRRDDPSVTAEEFDRRFPGCRDELLASVTVSLSAPTPAGSTDESATPVGGAEVPIGADAAGDADTRSRYRILRLHARGGLGEILAARDEELHREVALKRLLRRPGQEAEARGRFLREAEITSQLEHPGVVPVYGLGQTADGRPVYAMRFIRGETFQEAVERFHKADRPGHERAAYRLAFRQLLGRFLSVCNTIAYAHSRGVLHRDIKPGNILLGSYGETVVVDWGLAKTAGAAPVGPASGVETPPAPDGADLTQAGDVIGTPAYMSPEQAAGRWDVVGPASDIYSLGATLYVLLTGRPPFGLGSVGEVLEKVRRADFPPPRQVNKSVSLALQAVCLKAMAARPEMRYPTVLALAAELEQWLAGEPVGAWREPLTARARRWVGRHTALVAAAAVGLTACAVLAVVTALWFAAAEREQAAKTVSRTAQELADVRRAQLERADLERYGLHIAAADREWWADHFDAAAQHLAECKPGLHGWEWNYMARRGLDGESLLTLQGHTKEVWNVAFSPDGGRLVSASLDGTVRVWDAADGRQLFKLDGHAGKPVWGLAFSPDGALLATGGGDRTVRLWDAKTGQPGRVFTNLAGEVRGVAFSPDGKTLAAAIGGAQTPGSDAAAANGEVRLWRLADGTKRDAFPVGTGDPTSVAFSPDGQAIAAGTVDRLVRRWDVTTGEELDALRGHSRAVEQVAYSPDGRWLASASNDGSVRLWDAKTGQVRHVLSGHTMPAWGVAFSPDSRRVASSADDTTIKLWDVELGRLVQTLHGHTQGIANVTFSADGKRLASASDDQTVRVWSLRAPRAAQTLCGHKHAVVGVAFGPNGRAASAGLEAQSERAPGDDSAVRVWDAAGRELVALSVPGGARCVAFSPDGLLLAAAGDDNAVHVWDGSAGWRESVLRGHEGKVECVAFSPDGKTLASASADHTVVMWEAATWKERLTYRGHDGEVHSVAFSPDGKRVASAGDDKAVKIWDPATGREDQTLAGSPAAIRGVAFSPDGKRLAAATVGLTRVLTREAGEIVVWDLETGQTALTLRGYYGDVRAVAYSPDGKRLISGGSDGWLKMWEPTTGQEILTIYDAHLDCINAVAFSPDGARLASASCDGTVILWNGAPPAADSD